MKILAGLFLLFAVRLTAAYAADAEVRTFPAAELTGLSFAAGPGDSDFLRRLSGGGAAGPAPALWLAEAPFTF